VGTGFRKGSCAKDKLSSQVAHDATTFTGAPRSARFISRQEKSEREPAGERGKTQVMPPASSRPEGAARPALADDVGLVFVGRSEQAGERNAGALGARPERGEIGLYAG